jgi:hypothetical protein
MSVKEGRVLEEFEHVDHINNDPLDDRIENLQILSLAQNNKKYQSEVLKGRLMVELICPCGTQFSKERRNTHILESNGAKNTYCSRRCSSTFGKSLKETKTILVREFREFE